MVWCQIFTGCCLNLFLLVFDKGDGEAGDIERPDRHPLRIVSSFFLVKHLPHPFDMINQIGIRYLVKDGEIEGIGQE